MSNPLYRPEIDGLRSLSIIAVVLYHAEQILPGGYIGVDVFLVISGFLITQLILKPLEANAFTLAEFWERRIRRILPALAVMVASVLVAGYFLLLPTQLVELAKSSVAQAVFLANVHFWQDTGYFTAPAEQKPLLHTWSLAVEEQFYFVFPLVLVAVHKLGTRHIRIALTLLFVISLSTAAYGVYHDPIASFFLLPTRAWELLAGSLLAVMPKTSRLPRFAHELISCVGVSAILFAAFRFSHLTLIPGRAAIIPVAGTVAFIFANSTGATVVGRILSLPPFVFVGKISYSLYLWHWPIIVFAAIALGRPLGWMLLVPAIATSFFVAVLSWQFVERPFRNRSIALNRPAVFVSAAIAQLIVLGTSAAFWVSNGLPQRLVELQRVIADSSGLNPKYESFIHELETDRIPVLGPHGATGKSVDFALFGDSHALVVAPLFDLVAERRGVTGLVVAQNGTPAVSIWPWDEVNKRNELFLKVLTHKHIKNVCMVVRWDFLIDKSESSRRFRELINSMEKAGVEYVFVFRQVPRQPLDDSYSQQIVASYRFPRWVALPRISADEYKCQIERETQHFFRDLPDSATLQVEVIDTASHCFDESGLCRVLESGRALYYDDRSE